MIIPSYAKINLGLKIINKRPDGLHNIESVFLQISLHDSLTFSSSNKFSIISKGISCPTNQNNILFKVIDLLKKEYDININFKVLINKNIPIGAGLGGGSSNAAAFLKYLLEVNQIKLSNEKLVKLASQIGSDVPFFLNGGFQLIKGTGDYLQPIETTVFNNKKILLIHPKFHISTKWAYSEVKKHLLTSNNKPKFSALTEKVNWNLFENDFEKFVCTTYPEILKLKKLLKNDGALYSGLSGSGSTVFGLYNDNQSFDNILSLLKDYHTNIAFPIIQ
tara:strand:+ start:684 stop:1514 length:831 start_codon:yes stop_codon:yes gene_type:complete